MTLTPPARWRTASGALAKGLASLLATLLLATTPQRAHATEPRIIEGRLPSGASYRFELPEPWNGRVLLFSHGYAPGPANPARTSAGEADKAWLLARGDALIGSSYARTGWAVAEAVPDQLATLDAFVQQVGKPRQVLAWGSSMGALVTVALIEQHPERFDGGLALCGSIAGTLAMMNQALDGAFVFATLAAPQAGLALRMGSPLLGAGRADRPAQQAAWRQAVDAAQATPLGRARLGLAATLAQVAPWADGARPAEQDVAAQQRALARNLLAGIALPRDDQEMRAGGNFSWNTGIDYARQLQRSGREAFVQALYQAAGADLAADLATLARAPRLASDPAATAYMARHYVPDGRLRKPLLALQTTVDPLTLPEFSEDYLRQAQAAGAGELARSVYVERIAHCRFSAAETVAALLALQQRVDTGRWATEPEAMRRSALASGAAGSADFVAHTPQPLLRSCGRRPGACPGGVLP